MNKNIPNAISVCRIILCIPLFLLDTMSVPFIVIYVVAFATDILDGNLARLTNTCSDLGKNLDSIADAVYFLVFMFKIIPWMNFPNWALIWFFAILFARLAIFLFVKYKSCRFIPSHSVVNKITAMMIFAVPFIYLLVGWIIIPIGLALASLTVISDFRNGKKLLNEQLPKS